MKYVLFLLFLLLQTFANSQNSTPVSKASMMANSAKVTINHCTEKDISTPILNRIVVQPSFSDQEIDFLRQLPLSERDILTEATFIDDNNINFPYKISVNYPNQGFYVIGFSKYLNFSGSLRLNDENELERTICEEDLLGILSTKMSPFARFLSGEIDTIRMAFYREFFGPPKTQWIMSKSETENLLIVEEHIYTKKDFQEKKVSLHFIEPAKFDELLAFEQSLRQNVIESYQTELKTKSSISMTDGEFSWRLELTGKKNQYHNRFLQLFK
ncbi:MAG: hypothetical protein ACRBG0_14850 [Lewinella sp.]|uniref:hypothetical protein n=1 Tax=Lewinella sp. TaxID=2004506 RepID=UPI003D6B9A68